MVTCVVVMVRGRRFRLWRGGVMTLMAAAMAGMARMIHGRRFGLMMARMPLMGRVTPMA